MVNRKWLKEEYLLVYVFILFALLIRLVVAVSIYEPLDIIYFNYQWATAPVQSLWTIYQAIGSLDYPPIFPVWLRFIGSLMNENQTLVFLLLKIFPIFCDLGISVVLFSLVKVKRNGMILSALWLLNPAGMFNSAFWGQVDSLLVLLIIICFYFLNKQQPIKSSIFFAVGCLAKLQFCYLAPLFLGYLFLKHPLKKALQSLIWGIIIGLLGWLPFMIGSGDMWLPFRIYLGGANKYPQVNMAAFNVYGLLVEPDRGMHAKAFQLISFSSINLVLLLGIIGFVVMLTLKYFRKNDSLYVIGAIYLNSIFMFTMMQHERYQFPVLAFILLMLVETIRIKWLIWYGAFSIIIFMNQFLLHYSYYQPEPFKLIFEKVLPIGSLINQIVSIIFLLSCLTQLKKQKPQLLLI